MTTRPLRHTAAWALCLGLLCGGAVRADEGGAAALLLMRDGEVLREHGADTPRRVASLAKLMTALLVLESGRDLDELVAVAKPATRETGTRLRLRAGERASLHDLLAATVIASANDACHALASAIAGDEATFVARMNARAAALGLVHTRYRNACGHDAPGQRSTAREVAQLATRVMRDARFRTLARATQGELRVVAPRPRTLRFASTNLLLGRYEGVVGIKTGFTPGAGKCLVAFALRDDRAVLLVLLDAPDRWWTAVGHLDAAFGGATGLMAWGLTDGE